MSISAKLDFSSMSIYNMNSQYPWNNTITNSYGLDDNTTYNLHATGYASLDGRQYVALPKNLKITSDVKKQYNLM